MIFLFCKYYDNEDSSIVEMKQYHDSPSGRYPSFTFCLYAEGGELFKGDILQPKFGITQKEYYQQLIGVRDAMNSDLTKMIFDRAMTKIDDFLVGFKAEDYYFQKYNRWDFTMTKIKNSPLQPSYRDPTINCFTYNTEYSQSVTLREISVKFNITKFQNMFPLDGKLYIIAHYPGQLMRNIRKYMKKFNHWNELKSDNNNNHIVFSFSGLTVMRLRENAVNPCDPNLMDDDTEWEKHVIKSIGCIPPYWNNNSSHYLEPEKICNSKNELESIKGYWPKEDSVPAMQIFQNYTRPCNSFEQLIYNSDVRYYKKSDVLKMQIKLQNNMYQEVHNTKAFKRADLWANIGGFVGIFCGFSMLQTTTYLIDSIKELLIYIKK